MAKGPLKMLTYGKAGEKGGQHRGGEEKAAAEGWRGGGGPGGRSDCFLGGI